MPIAELELQLSFNDIYSCPDFYSGKKLIVNDTNCPSSCSLHNIEWTEARFIPIELGIILRGSGQSFPL